MKKIYLLLVIINAITAIWCAAMGNLLGVILMIILAASNVNFYFEEKERRGK